MKPTYPLRLFFDCPTVHLSPESRDWLDARARGNEDMIGATPYGWFLWMDEASQADKPAGLAIVIDHARQLGAEYILFDRDAPENDALPVFED